MKLSYFIAVRYLFSKKKLHAIHVINRIAVFGFGVGAFAMVVILSAFNGFEALVDDLISHYDPEIEITAKGKKHFVPSDKLYQQIEATPEVESHAESLEEKVVLKYNNRQEIARIKGVDAAFDAARFDSLMVAGQFTLADSQANFAVLGGGLSGKLGIYPGSGEAISVFVPNRKTEYNSLDPSASLNMGSLFSSGIFVVHEEIDNEVFLTDIRFTRELLDMPGGVSSIELSLKEGSDRSRVKEQLQEQLGTKWVVRTREEQNELLYKIFRSEKWFTYAILCLVLFISAFNIFGSLIMLVLDKKKDIGILRSMGAPDGLLRKVFLWQGTYIAVAGGVIGSLLGVLLIALQERYGLLSLQNGIVEAYPVKLVFSDLLLTLLTVLVLGLLISWYPSSRAASLESTELN